MNTYLKAGGKTGSLIHDYHWSDTLLGSPDQWSQSLLTTLNFVLNAQLPLLLLWGTDYTVFYNDQSAGLIGNDVLGKSAKDAWPQEWPGVKPLVDRVLAIGEGLSNSEHHLLKLTNSKNPEATWTFSYNPVFDETASPVGVLVTISPVLPIQEQDLSREPIHERYKLIIDSQPTPLVVLNSQGTIIEVNQAGRRFSLESTNDGSGYIGSNYRDVYNRLAIEEADQLIEGIGKVLSGNLKEFKADFQYHAPSRTYWYQARVFPLIVNDTVIEVVVKHLDITERTENKLSIQRALEEKQKILDNSVDVICTFDEEGRIIQVNQACREVWGYEPDELLGNHYMNLVAEADQPKTSETADLIMQGNRIRYFENSNIRKDGSLVPMTWSASWDPQQRTLFCIGRDSTERKRAEQQLVKYNQKVSNILESITDGFLAVDTQWRITYWNKTAEDIFDIERSRALGSNLWELIPGARGSVFYIEFHRAMADQLPAHFEARSAASPSPMWVDVNAYPSEEGLSIYFRNITERKQAEEQIRRANERYVLATRVTQDVIYEYDIINNTTQWGEGVKNLFGYDLVNEFITLEIWMDLIHPEDVDRVKENYIQILQSPDTLQFENTYRLRKADGSYATILGRGVIVRDKDGNPSRIVGSIQDVSETTYYLTLEKLEREVLQMHAMRELSLPELLDHYLREIELLHPGMLCSIMEVKESQLYTLASPHLPEAYQEAIEGLEIGDNVGSCGSAVYLKNKVVVEDIQNDTRWAPFRKVAAEACLGACWSQPIVGSEGEVLATLVCYYTEPKAPSRQEENTIERTRQLLQIILENNRQEEALLESNTRYELVTKATSEAIWDWDLVTDKVYMSEAYSMLFGHDHSINTLDEVWTLYIHQEDKERVYASFRQSFSNSDNNIWQDDYRFFRADGSIAYVHDRGLILRDKAGQAIRMVGAMVDVTQQREREQEREQLIKELVRSNEHLRQFSFITSHNFRAPLSNLIGWLKLIEGMPIEDPMLAEAIDGFSHSTYALNETVDDLIKILVIKESTSRAREKIRFRDIFETCCTQLKAAIEEVGAELNINDNKAPVVYFDKPYLESIFLNLLSNALKFHSPSRKLRIDIITEMTDKYVQLIVKDNGIGFDAQRYRDRLFGLYQRFHLRPDSKGLGLYLVKSQIEALGGSITVESQVDQGTTFTIQFQKVEN